ncbi:MAG: hypothetical protein LUD50_04985 [Clostridia bacterium]|nr:hypothetical protein [Clostridia bacterium]
MKAGFKITATVLSLAFASLIVLPACSGCNKDKGDSGTEVSLESTNLSGVYTPGADINFYDITMSIKVSYSDGTSKTLNSFVFEDENYTSSTSADFIVYTNGFYDSAVAKSNSGIAVGEYPITCKLVENSKTYDLGMTITVTDDIAGNFSLISAAAPSLYTTYQQNLTRVGVDASNSTYESYFYESPECYEVGDDNPFVFSPSLLLLKNGASVTDSGSMAYLYDPAVTSTVSYNDSVLDANNDYVTIDGSSFQFTEKAIGKEFTVSVTPALYSGNSNITAYSMTVKVEDGYNVYTPKDLGRISLADDNIQYDEYQLGKAGGASWYEGLDTSGAPKLTDEVDISGLWKTFLEGKGADESGLVPVHGIFIHSDLTVTQSDIPSEYFVGEEEAQAASKIFGANYDELVGSLRDWGLVYIHYMGNSESFTFNGNLFNIDLSQIGITMTCTDVENYYYPANYTGIYYGGSNVAFTFNGKTNEARNNAAVASSVTFENVESIGNTSGLLSDTEGKVEGSMQFLRSETTHIEVDNCIIKNQRIAFYCEYTDSTYEGFTVNNTKVYDCYNGVISSFLSAKNSIHNCEFKRFGGPICIAACNNGYKEGYCYSGITIDENTVAENYMSGNEAWFTIRGIDAAIAPIKNIASYFDQYGKTYLKPDGTFNLYFAITDIDYANIDNIDSPYLYGNFSYGNGTQLYLDNSTSYNTATEGTDEYYASVINEAIYTELNDTLLGSSVVDLVNSYIPIFLTNTGELLFLFVNLGDYSQIVLKTLNSGNCNALYSLAIAPEFTGFNEDDTMIYFVYPYGKMMVGVALELFDVED